MNIRTKVVSMFFVLSFAVGSALAGEETLQIGDGFVCEGFFCKDNVSADGNAYLTCEGKVVNGLPTPAKVGTVAMMFYDKNGGLLDTSTVEMDLELQPNENMPFNIMTPVFKMEQMDHYKVEHRK